MKWEITGAGDGALNIDLQEVKNKFAGAIGLTGDEKQIHRSCWGA